MPLSLKKALFATLSTAALLLPGASAAFTAAQNNELAFLFPVPDDVEEEDLKEQFEQELGIELDEEDWKEQLKEEFGIVLHKEEDEESRRLTLTVSEARSDILALAWIADKTKDVLDLRAEKAQDAQTDSFEYWLALSKMRLAAGNLSRSADAVLAQDPDYVITIGEQEEEIKVSASDARKAAVEALEAGNKRLRFHLKQRLSSQSAAVPSEEDFPRLMYLVAKGKPDAIEAELDRTGQPNAHKDHQTAMLEAAKRGLDDVIKLLARRGADPNWISWKSSPMRETTNGRHPETIRLLKTLGADLNVQNGDNLETPLVEASRKGLTEVVRVLLEEGANPYAVDWQGSRALDWARHNNHQDIVQLLEPITKGTFAAIRD